MSDIVKIAAASVTMEPASLAERLSMVRSYIARASKQGAAIVCLPEYLPMHRTIEAMAMDDRPYYRLAEASDGGEFTAAIREQCRRCGIGALFGTVTKDEDGIARNQAISVSSGGEILGTYAKTHLACGENEFDGITAGDSLDPVATEFGLVGIVICCEIDFPEISRTLQRRGARWLFSPTASTAEMSYVFARARARENRLPVVHAAYSWPAGSGNDSCASAIIDAAGEPLRRSIHSDKLICCDVDLSSPIGAPYWDKPDIVTDLRQLDTERLRPELFDLPGYCN